MCVKIVGYHCYNIYTVMYEGVCQKVYCEEQLDLDQVLTVVINYAKPVQGLPVMSLKSIQE